jgi:hypothetical protein
VSQFDPLAGPEDERILEVVGRWPDLDPGDILRRTATPITAVSDGRYKLTLRGDEERLLDLEADPLELGPPAAGVPADAVGRLRAVLGGAAEGAGEIAPAAPSPEELADIEERMRLLGYM